MKTMLHPESAEVRACHFSVRLTWIVLVLVWLSSNQDLAAQLTILEQPANVSASVGATASFRVVAWSNEGGTFYQWYFNNEELPGAISDTLILTNIQLSQAGPYYVIVTDDENTIQSRTVTLHIGPTFTRITTGPLVTDLGCSWLGSYADYDDDGYPDLHVGRFWGGRSTLYHNNGDGTFIGVTNSVFPLAQGGTCGGTWADFDNDGMMDLFVFGWNWNGPSPTTFYFGDNSAMFTPIGFDSGNPWNVSAADYDNDGLLDLYFSSGSLSGGSGVNNRLYRNFGGRTFRAMTAAEVGPIVDVATFGGATWADYDDDGWVDVFAPGNQGAWRLFRNDGKGSFVSLIIGLPMSCCSLAGAWADYDNDGRVDLCVASFFGISGICRNLGNGEFALADIGVISSGLYNSVAMADYDNDGFLDMLMTYGNEGKNLLFHNNGDGTFTALPDSIISTDQPAIGNGSVNGTWFDYDNDGFLDLFVVNGNDPGNPDAQNFLYHNEGNANAWLKVKLVGTVSNRNGAGAKVRARATYAGQTRWQRRDISAGDVYNGNNFIAHFGVRDATNVEVLRVEWPSGIVQEIPNVNVNQMLTVTEPRIWMTMQYPDSLQILGLKRDTYVVKGSSDLVNWTTVGMATNLTGKVNFVDPEGGQLRQGFFKAELFD